MSAYSITNGPRGDVVTQLLDETAMLNTSFDNRGFQEFLSNNCYLRKPTFAAPSYPFCGAPNLYRSNPPNPKVWARMDNPFDYYSRNVTY